MTNQINPASIEAMINIRKAVENGDATWAEAAEVAAANGFNWSKDVMRQGFRFMDAALAAGYQLSLPGAELDDAAQKAIDNHPNLTEQKSDGSVYMDRLVQVFEDVNPNDGPAIMKALNLDPKFWELINAKTQMWHGATKNGGKQILCNIKANVRPKTYVSTEDAIDMYKELVAKKPAEIEKAWKNRIPTEGDGDILEVNFSDAHIGLWSGEGRYNMTIARRTVYDMAASIVARAIKNKRKYKYIALALTGDILHINSSANATANGTKQDIEGTMREIYRAGFIIMRNFITILKLLNAPIKVIYVPGNHDLDSGRDLVHSLHAYYACDPNMEFVDDDDPHKMEVFGRTAVLYSHGEMKDAYAHVPMLSKGMFSLAANGVETFEAHLGHLHHTKVSNPTGFTNVRRLRSICDSCNWAHNKAFPGDNHGWTTFTYNFEGELECSDEYNAKYYTGLSEKMFPELYTYTHPFDEINENSWTAPKLSLK